MSKESPSETESKKKKRSLLFSFGVAFSGIWFALLSERNMKIHLVAALCAVGVGIWVELDALRWAILCLTISLVFVLEILNTAMEQMVDLVSPELRQDAKLIKDLAAGAVLMAAICSVGVGLILFLPAMIEKLSTK